jgi:hypothetical protein
MSLGLGIFLSTLLVVVVYLYRITRDRWNWRKIGKRTLFAFVALIAMISAAIYGAQNWDHYFPTPVPPQTAYAGLHLGTSMKEVLYIKGHPSFVLGSEITDPKKKGWAPIIEIKNLPEGRSVHDYRDWGYELYRHRIEVTFDESRQRVMLIECYSGDSAQRCPSIGLLTDGASERELVQRLGQPTESIIDGTSGTKRMFYTSLNTFFLLSRETVYMIGIHDPKYRWRSK